MAKTREQLARIKYTSYLHKQGRATQVPVGPARAYLRQLHFVYGMSSAQLADRCTLSPSSVLEIIAGHRAGVKGDRHPLQDIFRENAESVMAIEPEIPKERGGAMINAIGTTRRVQGLAAIGYPVRWTRDVCGFAGQSFYLLAQGKRSVVFFSTAYRIKALYEKHELDLHPERHGISMQAVRLTKTYAARNGYLPPILWDWDTIDDPEGYPNYTGFCGSQKGAQLHEQAGTEVCGPCITAAGVLDSRTGRKVL